VIAVNVLPLGVFLPELVLLRLLQSRASL
jgi:hypothetical protein